MSASPRRRADVPMPARRTSRSRAADGRPWTFWVLATLFTAYVLALYGPMICIYVLSFQDVRGGLVFPMKGCRCTGSSTCSRRCAPAT